MRSPSLVAASALIAVVALVAAAGPARTQVPGTAGSVDPQAFTRLAPPLPGAMTSPTLSPPTSATAPRAAAGLLDAGRAIVEPGDVPVPSGRAAPAQPNAPLRVTVKPTPTPRPVVASTGGGGGGGTSGGTWRRAEYSWYGPGFYGNGTACGQTYSKTILGTAHRTLPCGTKVTFRNPSNGRTITVPVIDRGPYTAGRTFDLSAGTCSYLGNCYTGTIQYRLP